jgi:hypothetical protein
VAYKTEFLAKGKSTLIAYLLWIGPDPWMHAVQAVAGCGSFWKTDYLLGLDSHTEPTRFLLR